ncbi:MAG: PHB depolymerase family esterase [Anaerolineae bacterium]|nr:PHB depolymerase family esterase [Anaerolineae bacterium]MDQ7035507.1 PHB depolymerase family esterase [Anaerolineae bacterium]
MRRLFLVLLAVLLSTAYSAAQAQVGTELHMMTYDGQDRSYYVYTPEIDATRLMMILHPVASSGLAMEVETGFNDLADTEGYVVVYPNSLNSVWDDGRIAAGLLPTGDSIDDVGFLATLAESVASEYGINSSQIYIAGVGNGASMAMTAACQTPDSYAGVGIVSALLWDYQVENCGDAESETAVNMIFIYGSRDPVYLSQGNPITDQDGNVLWAIQGVSDTADFWINFNGCDPSAYESFSQTTLTIFNDCNNDAQFAWFSVLGGGSTWLRPDARVNGYLGIDTSAILHAFFTGDTGDDNLSQLVNQETVPDDQTLPRSWLIYVPTTYDDSTPTPVVVGLHGRFANAFHQANASDFNTIAEREGIIMVYPNALNSDRDPAQTEWNYGRDVPRYASPDHNDEAFIQDLIDDIDDVLNIDRSRLYVTGLSNGGAMTQRMACTEGDTYAAFASVAAIGYFGLPTICNNAGHAPILFYNGTADTIMPWEGTRGLDTNGNEVYLLAPMDATAAFWADLNGCGETFDAQDLPSTDADSTVRLVVFNTCPDDAAVVLFAVVGGGHVWPGIRDFDSQLLGEVNMDYNASEVIWDFFSQYTLEGRVDANGNLLEDEALTINDVAPVDLDAISAEADTTANDESTNDSADTENPADSNEAFVINQLRQGGYVIFINHATTDASQEDTSLDSCETQRNLNELGIAEAQSIGRAFEIMGIPVGHVYSTGSCRADDTATLAFGETEVRDDLFDLGILVNMLSETPEAGTNTIIVGQSDVLFQYTNIQIGEGDSVIFLPMGNGNYRPLTQIASIDWVTLAAYYVENLQGE